MSAPDHYWPDPDWDTGDDDFDWDGLIDQYDRRLDDHAEDPFLIEEASDNGR
jgi:hypothetical protein